MKLEIFDKNKKKADEIEVADRIFGLDTANEDVRKKMDHVVYHTIRSILTNKRQGNAQVKTKGMITASTKKPWRQKGTGRARVGSKKSPLWTGGGVIFGPSKKVYNMKVSKKVRREALFSTISDFHKNGKLMVVQDPDLKEYKTKMMDLFFQKLTARKKVCFVIHSKNNEAYSFVKKSSANLPYLKMMHTDALNIKDLFYADEVVMTKSAVSEINNRYAGKSEPKS